MRTWVSNGLYPHVGFAVAYFVFVRHDICQLLTRYTDSVGHERERKISLMRVSLGGVCVPRVQNENIAFLPDLRKSMFTRTRMSDTRKGITRHASFPQKSSFLAFHLEQGIMCLLVRAEKLDLRLHNIYPLIWQTYSSTSDPNVLSTFYQVSSTSKWHSFKTKQTKTIKN